jgi:hypothetical protein
VFRRLFWLLVGVGVGFGGSFWLTRYVRQTVARYTPERLSSDMAHRIRGFGADVRMAVSEGRRAMLEREAQLRGEDLVGREIGRDEPAIVGEPGGPDPRPVPNGHTSRTSSAVGRHPRQPGRSGRRPH